MPAWFPFASFKRAAERGRKQIEDFIERPFAFVKGEMVCVYAYFLWRMDLKIFHDKERGTAPHSLVHDMLSEKDPLLDKEAERNYIIMHLFGGLYGGEMPYIIHRRA